MDIADVRKAFVENKFRYTKHGTEQRINRRITGEDIKQAILTGEIIENYPTDKYGPSYLVYGKNRYGKTTTRSNSPFANYKHCNRI